MTRAYTSTVVAVPMVVAAIALGGATSALALAGTPALIAGTSALLVVVVGVHLAVVRLVANDTRIAFGWGLWGRLRVVERRDVRAADAQQLTRAQVFGLRVGTTRRTTRLTVRPGPALSLRLVSGETIRISTPEPAAAVHLLTAASPSAAGADPRNGNLT